LIIKAQSAAFVSDIHLQANDPHTAHWFFSALKAQVGAVQWLVLLGDVFEAWVGDDHPEPLAENLIQILQSQVASGGHVAIMHGNRDFLIGQAFCTRAGAMLLPDPCVIQVAGISIYCTHGDALCTDDVVYQAARKQARDPLWQQTFLAQPLADRLAFAQAQRQASQVHKAGLKNTSDDLMDVNTAHVKALALELQTQGVHWIVHGHTHRPALHHDAVLPRWVLSDWMATGNGPQRGDVLVVKPDQVLRV
jgi:UDP-2,3-diacylglucosamine hydrolase